MGNKDYKFTPAKAWKHFKLITHHKFRVGVNCFRVGLYWQGLVHDLSKYSPTEFINSVKYYNGHRSPIEVEREQNGYSLAWLHHKGRNKHHHEYWIDHVDQGGIPIKIPFKYALEMVCDSVAAGQVYTGKGWEKTQPYNYWQDKRKFARMHKETLAFFDYAYWLIAQKGLDAFDELKNMESLYMNKPESFALKTDVKVNNN